MGFPLITLTTDFGTRDPYVAEMKGVVLQINPQATMVDISHQIAPQDVAQGAFVLGSAYPFFPQHTVHVAVVDPGVGTSRRAILLVTQEGLFLAPDNGLITYAVRESAEYRAAARGTGFLEPMEVAIPGGYAAYTLSNRSLWREAVSDTFHGRDIFSPVAAHLSLGIPPEQVGEPLDSLVCLCIPHPTREGNALLGHVIHVDGFGNLVTTVDGGGLDRETVEVVLKGHRIQGVSRSYAQGPDLLAIVGSHGFLEIAARDGSAARELGAQEGDEVVVRW